jgi:hypothetical protein
MNDDFKPFTNGNLREVVLVRAGPTDLDLAYDAAKEWKQRALRAEAQLSEIYLVASGERQVANDDTEALAWIAERCKEV